MKDFLRYINTNIRLLITLLAVGILLGACSKDNDMLPPAANNGDYISLYSQIAGQKTRLSSNNFEVNESIGLYVVPFESDNTTPGAISSLAYAANKQHIFDGTSWSLKSGGKVSWPNSTTKVDLYAYHPYNEVLTYQDPTAYNFAVNTNQQAKTDYDASDFLWSKANEITPTMDAIGLTFSHKLSKVKINVKSEIDLLNSAVSKASVSILNVKPEGIVNLADGSVSAVETSASADILPLHVTATSGYDITFEGIVIPQTLEAGIPFIKIELNYNGYIRYSYIPADNIILEAGKERSFNISITKIGISVTVDNIKDWEPTDPIDGELGTYTPRVLNIDDIDWSKSLVHTVYYKENPLAEVAKEYIYKNGTVDYQAIVIYPMGIDGKPDLTKGFIARVMNRSRNSSTNVYEANASNIHGGSVSFSNNTLQSYTVGNQPLFSMVEIVSKDEIKVADDESVASLTTEPDILTDIDGNQYPIVKIGTQYWIRENLKVEHYKDDSELTYYYYNDNIGNKEAYGAYYTWATIMDSRGIAPDGWRVPSSDDFVSLYEYLTPDAGMKLKANIMWSNLNYNDDVTGFSGLPTGRRTNSGTYNELNNYGQWWTTTISGSNAYRLYLDYGNRAMHHTTLGQTYTQSIRLLRD